jgi:excisionase family DNA binding protein
MKLETTRHSTTAIPEQRNAERTKDMQRFYQFLLQPSPALIDQFGTRIAIPEQLYTMMRTGLELLLQGRPIVIIPGDDQLTIQAAVNLLGVSRPYLIERLIGPGKIPFTYAGSHRRIKFDDLRRYMLERDRERHEGS